eukprot:6229267-Heterocapsa_arctica.AAC.1
MAQWMLRARLCDGKCDRGQGLHLLCTTRVRLDDPGTSVREAARRASTTPTRTTSTCAGTSTTTMTMTTINITTTTMTTTLTSRSTSSSTNSTSWSSLDYLGSTSDELLVFGMSGRAISLAERR